MSATAIQVLQNSIVIGMNTNGWTFDQAYKAAIAAMIATDKDAMTDLATHI